MIKKFILTTSILAFAAYATSLELAKEEEEEWVILGDEEVIALHQDGLVIEGPNWTATYSPDSTNP